MKAHTFSERLKEEKRRRRWRQQDVAKAFGISISYAGKLEAGILDPSDNMLRELELMEAAPGYESSTGGDVMRDVKVVGLRYIPVLSWAHAGDAVCFDELPQSWQDRIPSDAKDPKAFAIEVRGDSMEPQIRDGDRVILLPSQEPRNGDIVVVKFKDDGISLKLYHESGDGRTINLASFNPIYPPRDYHVDALERIVPVQLVVKTVRF